MISDLVSYWRNIIGMLNILCPRPEQANDSVVHDHVSSVFEPATSSASLSGAFSLSPSKSSRKGHGVSSPRKRRAVVDDNPPPVATEEGAGLGDANASSSKFVKKFFGMFVSKGPVEPQMNDQRNSYKRQKSAQANKIKEIDEEVQAHTAHIQQTADDERPVKVPVLYVFDYGKPRYGMSQASWMLLVQARMAIEEVILRLNLDPRMILARQKVQVDVQLLHDLGSRIGISGMIAEGDSEDDFSVSRADSEASLDLGLRCLDFGGSAHSALPISDENKPIATREIQAIDNRFRTPANEERRNKSGIAELNIEVPTEEPGRSSSFFSLKLPQQSNSPKAANR